MTCKHLKELYEMCRVHQVRLSSSDLIHMVCSQCGIEEVCPSVLCEEYETRHPSPSPGQSAGGDEEEESGG